MIAKYSFNNYKIVLSPTSPLEDVITLHKLEIFDDIKTHSPDIFVNFRDVITAVAYMHQSAPHVPNVKIDQMRKQIWMRMSFCQADIITNKMTLNKLSKNYTYNTYYQSVYGKTCVGDLINKNNNLMRYYFDLEVALSFINDIIDHLTEKRDIDNMLMEATCVL